MCETNKTYTTIASIASDWNSMYDVEIYECGGTIYHRFGFLKPEVVEFDQHIGVEKVSMTRGNVEKMGHEFDKNAPKVYLPSHLFYSDMEERFGANIAKSLVSFFEVELRNADEREDKKTNMSIF